MEIMNENTYEKAVEAKAKALLLCKDFPEINGIGIRKSIGDGFGLKINLVKTISDGRQLPTSIDGVSIWVEIVGPIRKMNNLTDVVKGD
jgi:hypothetical protein